MSTEQLLYDLKIYNDVTGEMLGYVVAMDDEGMQVVMDQAIDLEKESFYTVDNILEMSPGHTALFAAVCDQCAPEEGDDSHYHAHLTFTQLSSAANELKQVLH